MLAFSRWCLVSTMLAVVELAQEGETHVSLDDPDDVLRLIVIGGKEEQEEEAEGERKGKAYNLRRHRETRLEIPSPSPGSCSTWNSREDWGYSVGQSCEGCCRDTACLKQSTK